MKEHVRIIGQYRKIGSRPRNFVWINLFWHFKPQNFAQVATVTWMVGSSNFWYQNDRINIVFHHMDSDFLISRLVAGESEMNDFWRNFVERHFIDLRILVAKKFFGIFFQTDTDIVYAI